MERKPYILEMLSAWFERIVNEGHVMNECFLFYESIHRCNERA